MQWYLYELDLLKNWPGVQLWSFLLLLKKFPAGYGIHGLDILMDSIIMISETKPSANAAEAHNWSDLTLKIENGRNVEVNYQWTNQKI